LGESGTPALPSIDIYQFLEERGYQAHKTDNAVAIEKSVDFLNEMVRQGQIIKHPCGVWMTLKRFLEKISESHLTKSN